MHKSPARRKITKGERKIIYEKCGRHCAYCGKQINLSEMQVDHLMPMELTVSCSQKKNGADDMSEEKYILTLTRDQAITAQNALELYARLRIGQFNRITELMLDVRSVDDYCQRRDLANDLFKIVACIIFGRNDYNQPNCQKDTLHHRAWNIYTALRYQMAWHDHPEGGWGVHYDEPYPWGGEAVPECVVQQDTAATAHISNAAAAGMSIAEAKDAADAMLQMFANSHDRDRERMASDAIGVEDDQQKEK